MSSDIHKSDDDYRAQLTPEQYRVTRQKGTEMPFSGEYWNHTADGKYHCICCGAELFHSETKFDSHCGWPSFYSPANDKIIATATRSSAASAAPIWGTSFPTGPSPPDSDTV
jgi:peptide-methionine (R)-S-oxide reductase